MNYITHNEDEISVNGTWLRGYIDCSYNKMIQVLGHPFKYHNNCKTDAEWYLEFEDGSIATIYNWKNGINYCGPDEGTPTELITVWNVGGNGADATRLVLETLEGMHNRGVTLKV
jgi:hypothetical protein